MNASNQVSIIGNVGQPPELKGQTKSGRTVVSFSVAQNTSAKDVESGEYVQKEPQWFRIACFANLAERVQSNLIKGDLVLVVGELKANSFTDPAGTKRLTFEINAKDVLKVERLATSVSSPEKGGQSQ